MRLPNLANQYDAMPEYAFPRLRRLLNGLEAEAPTLSMSIGEPKHAPPAFVCDALSLDYAAYAKYPPIQGIPALNTAIAGWLFRRFNVSIDPVAQILPLNGTREGLFMSALACIPREKNGQQPAVLMPNPFYQCYAAAAIAAGAEPIYVPATQETGHLPDFASLPESILSRTAFVFLCSPANPQGAVASPAYLQSLIAQAARYNFTLAVDECYTELYQDTAPTGVLEISESMQETERVLAFHSLSKRSNLAGLRSGFVAGSEYLLSAIGQLRSYAGPTNPIPAQQAAALAWDDDQHVIENRTLYQQKFALAEQILGHIPNYQTPAGGFFLWLPVTNEAACTQYLWRTHGVRVLPGSYLARDTETGNPGCGYIRAALVEPIDVIERGLYALQTAIEQGY